MGIFGWSLPPGCTQRHIDEAAGGDDGPCPCCGKPIDDCICPECPMCGECGNPECYGEGYHGVNILEYNDQQLLGQAKMRVAHLRSQIADEEMYIEQLEEKLREVKDGTG